MRKFTKTEKGISDQNETEKIAFHGERQNILLKNIAFQNAEHCVICGTVIPEGIMVCPFCEGKIL